MATPTTTQEKHMNTIAAGQVFKAREGWTLSIEAVKDEAAAAVATYPDGHQEDMLIALVEWPWIVEQAGLIPAGLAG